MNPNHKRLIIFLALWLVHGSALFGQQKKADDIYRSPVRKILNMFSVNLSSGYGYSQYSHNLAGFYFVQTPDAQYIFSSSVSPLPNEITGYANWVNNPVLGDEISFRDPYEVPRAGIERPVNNPLLVEQSFIINGDSSTFGFNGTSQMVPLLLSVHFNYSRFRLGVGYQFSQEFMGQFKPTVLEGTIRPLALGFDGIFQRRLFGIVGVKFYEWWNYGFVAEAQFGSIKPGKVFSPEFAQYNSMVNLGISIEKSISEYVRFTFRPSYDIRSYTITLPEAQGVIEHKSPSFMFQVGISVNFPEIPRTPMKADHVQLKHVYTDPETGQRSEVRGQPIWKWQNPKIGQNHRKIWRDKGRNRRKMNPY